MAPTGDRERMRRGWGRSGAVLAASLLAGALAPAAGATAPYVRKLPPLTTPWTRSVSTVAPLPAYPRPQLERVAVAEPQRPLAVPARDARSDASVPRRSGTDDPRPVPGSVAAVGDRARRHARVVPADLRGTGGVGRATRDAELRRGQLGGARSTSTAGSPVPIAATTTRSRSTSRGSCTAAGPTSFWSASSIRSAAPTSRSESRSRARRSGIYHTASSGIWQTVWLEPVACQAHHRAGSDARARSDRLIVAASATGGVGHDRGRPGAGGQPRRRERQRPSRPAVRAADPRTLSSWSPSDPYLYGLRIRLVSRQGHASIASAATSGCARSRWAASMASRGSCSMGISCSRAGALDQGYWPDGLYTPPTDAAIRFDIDAAKRLGYNMLREHQKVEPDRWYYWADRLGLLVWQDMPSMPTEHHVPPTPAGKAEFTRELARDRDPASLATPRSSPGCRSTRAGTSSTSTQLTRLVKRLDPSALVDSDSGSANCCNAVPSPASDIRDAHLYFGPFAVPADRQASVIGEYGGVLPFPPAGHAGREPRQASGRRRCLGRCRR